MESLHIASSFANMPGFEGNKDNRAKATIDEDTMAKNNFTCPIDGMTLYWQIHVELQLNWHKSELIGR